MLIYVLLTSEENEDGFSGIAYRKKLHLFKDSAIQEAANIPNTWIMEFGFKDGINPNEVKSLAKKYNEQQ